MDYREKGVNPKAVFLSVFLGAGVGADVDAYVVHTNYDEYAIVAMSKQRRGDNRFTTFKLYGKQQKHQCFPMDTGLPIIFFLKCITTLILLWEFVPSTVIYCRTCRDIMDHFCVLEGLQRKWMKNTLAFVLLSFWISYCNRFTRSLYCPPQVALWNCARLWLLNFSSWWRNRA